MKNLLLAISLLLFLLCSEDVFSQRRQIKEIRIKSAVGWVDEDHYSELLIRNVHGSYWLNGSKIETKLVDNLVRVISEPAIRYAQMANLGITEEWLNENSGMDMSDYLAERLDKALPSQKALFFSSFKNLALIKRTIPDFFSISMSDYYPEISVEIVEKNGRRTEIFSESQTLLSLPWRISKNRKKSITYNANISRAISNIMPERSANKKRLVGEDIRGELATAIMDAIEDKWNLLDAEQRVPKHLKEIREHFQLETALITEAKDGNGIFSATLRRKDFPKNFSVLLELPYRGGEVSNIKMFAEKIERYKKLVFAVDWLKKYILTHPEDDFRLNFSTEFSFGTALRDEFFEEIKSPAKQRLIALVRQNQDLISSIEVGGKYYFSQLLVLPDRRLVLFSYAAPNGLMKWRVKDLPGNECSNNKTCVGALISSSGKITFR